MERKYNLERAVKLCRAIEKIVSECGAHVALTGGCLYKDGERKDLDIIVYPHSGNDNALDKEVLFEKLDKGLGIKMGLDHGRIVKATWHGSNIDFFFLHPCYEGTYPSVHIEPVEIHYVVGAAAGTVAVGPEVFKSISKWAKEPL